jgi:hypothetical protein
MQPTILKRGQVRVEKLATPVLGSAEPSRGSAKPVEEPTPSCEKAVRLLTRGDVVQAIEVSCSCGEVTVVELEYPEPTAFADTSQEP